MVCRNPKRFQITLPPQILEKPLFLKKICGILFLGKDQIE